MIKAASLALVLAACSFKPASGGDPAMPTDAPPVETDAPPAESWLDGWSHRKSITLQASAIVTPSTGLIDFPVLISLDDPELATIALAGGTDIAFTTDDGTSLLAHELESYDAGRLVAWVKLPALLDADTRLYMYYGNASPPEGMPQQVWSASYLAVYHLQQNPGPGTANGMRDSSANGKHGTAAEPFQDDDSVDGQVGRGVQLNSDDQFIDVGQTDVGDAFTVSMWMNVSTDFSIQTLLSNSGNGNTTNGWRFFVNTSQQNDYVLRFETANGSSGDTAITPDDVVVPGTWHHVAAIVSKLQGRAQIFVDGVFVNPNDTSIGNQFESNSDFEIGRMENNTNPYGGMLDEVELASVMRPVEWIQTSHANQRAPSAFYAIGDQEMR